jgi:hypothetical protein
MIYEYGEPQWDNIDGKTEELGEKSVPLPHGLTLGLHGERQATNCLNHVRAFM